MSPKLLSLRGCFELDDNARMTDFEIFSYEANDLTRGWEIESAYIWPRTSRAETGGDSGQFLGCWSLATDTIGSVGLDELVNAEDNRQCGWIQMGWQRRQSAVADFLTNSGSNPYPAEFGLDPQTIVVSNLYLNGYTTSDSSTSPSRIWNYMVVLRPRKMQPMQTILHIIKGKAQDVDN